MKTIGLIGGMSWESTVTYYQIINETVKEKLGDLHSAKCIVYSVDFQEIETCQANGDWEKSAQILTDAAQSLERAGADFIIICTNTMHKVAPQIQKHIKVPLLHIAEMTALELEKNKVAKVGLLGTKYTMKQDFYKKVLVDHGIEVVVPNEADMEKVNDIIYQELCLGVISPKSREIYLKVIEDLVSHGAEGVILGCTEIGLLISQNDTSIPVFDTTKIHARQAGLLSISEDMAE